MSALAENAEDVSFSYIPGSVGSSGTCFVSWGPRPTPASDRARNDAIAALEPILSRFRAKESRPSQTPDRSREFVRARLLFFEKAARRG